MQRLVCLFLLLTAACGGGTATGTATLSNVQPPVKASATETFVGVDGAGQNVMGWNILLYQDEPGGDCLEGTVLAKISIYTNQLEGSKPQALLDIGGITITTMVPPMLVSATAANMGVEDVSNVTGQVTIEEFHLTPDAMHADRIRGSISAAGFDANDNGVSLTGTFTAPICVEE